MDDTLIFDIGLHHGEDTAYYLSLGYRVVGIEAEPGLIAQATQRFAEPIRNGSLLLAHCAVADYDGEATLYLSQQSLWNSLRKSIADRNHLACGSVRVPARRLGDLFAAYGVPLYCKMDIEGEEPACLATLSAASDLPAHMSVESESIAEGEQLTEAQALDTLDALARLGYNRFKLVDQGSLRVLDPPTADVDARPSARSCAFPPGASGPFGHRLNGTWLEYDSARDTLLHYRRCYFRARRAFSFGFWCDWHATRDTCLIAGAPA